MKLLFNQTLVLLECFIVVVWFFEAGSQVAPAGLKFAMQAEVTLNSSSSPLQLLRAEIVNMCHHALWLCSAEYGTQGFVPVRLKCSPTEPHPQACPTFHAFLCYIRNFL